MPTHQMRMQHRVQIRQKPLADFPRLPGFVRCLDGHINEYRRAQKVGFRHEAPVTAVRGIAAIVAQDKVTACGHGDRAVVVTRVRQPVAVGLYERLTVYIDDALANFYSVSGHADQTLDVVLVGFWRSAEDNHLLTPRLAPEAQVVTGEGNRRVVAHAAHKQVVAD